ncbi:hypothetical protein EJ05DRAFT_500529 [Pseudovirgaria hyperparasitica]|uniref:Uncharacterized protein n=1 Tax=Pseudovirgaria hyperparasitica TaxID=470096 RepID=A0A6A6WA71_9PEZI|nr:uncharacterized protein EJ05DRAFT_500529 [Pseudovirgaria hyperparasitica]KAF2758011.1 hypothetical protein EJ05DRAFT_500529 [Pseudovirgaria hyperparasitica]
MPIQATRYPQFVDMHLGPVNMRVANPNRGALIDFDTILSIDISTEVTHGLRQALTRAIKVALPFYDPDLQQGNAPSEEKPGDQESRRFCRSSASKSLPHKVKLPSRQECQKQDCARHSLATWMFVWVPGPGPGCVNTPQGALSLKMEDADQVDQHFDSVSMHQIRHCTQFGCRYSTITGQYSLPRLLSPALAWRPQNSDTNCGVPANSQDATMIQYRS